MSMLINRTRVVGNRFSVAQQKPENINSNKYSATATATADFCEKVGPKNKSFIKSLGPRFILFVSDIFNNVGIISNERLTKISNRFPDHKGTKYNIYQWPTEGPIKINWEQAEISSEKMNEKQKDIFFRILRFINGGKDRNGIRMLNMANASNRKKEAAHEFIQQFFMLDTLTVNNKKAFIVDEVLVAELNKQPAFVYAQQEIMFPSMLEHYGLENENGKISKAKNFKQHKKYWVGHNRNRFTRIGKSMDLFGDSMMAKSFMENVIEIYEQEMPTKVGDKKSNDIWKKVLLDIDSKASKNVIDSDDNIDVVILKDR